jgi:hypothetical protein
MSEPTDRRFRLREFRLSSSGKTIIIASTEGNVAVPERDEKIGLNVYRKK